MQGLGNTLYSYSVTIPVAASPAVSRPAYLLAVGSTLYMSGYDSPSGWGQELWSDSGSTAAPVLDINATSTGQGSTPAQLVALGTELYFSATDGINGRQLWKSDGTPGGTSMVYAITQGALAGANAVPAAAPLVVMGTSVYFPATPDTTNYYLYSYSGSGSPTQVSASYKFQAGATAAMIAYNNALYFRATDGTHGYQLYKFDGASVTQLPATNIAGDSLASTVTFGVYNNELYFAATDGSTGYQLYKTDGSTVSLVKTINTGGDANPGQFEVFNGRLYFSANDGTNGAQLWVLY
jgi:ELWxxDGT repeat protein